MVENGEVVCILSPAIAGHECNVLCNDGFTPDQNTVTCQTGGLWSGNPTCQGKQIVLV